MPPLLIQIMLACHVSAEPEQSFQPQVWSSQSADKARRWLVEQKLVEEGTWRATEKGSAWVKFICATPLPVIQWTLASDRPSVA